MEDMWRLEHSRAHAWAFGGRPWQTYFVGRHGVPVDKGGTRAKTVRHGPVEVADIRGRNRVARIDAYRIPMGRNITRAGDSQS